MDREMASSRSFLPSSSIFHPFACLALLPLLNPKIDYAKEFGPMIRCARPRGPDGDRFLVFRA